MEGDLITMNDIFTFHTQGLEDENGRLIGELKPTGIRPKLSDSLGERGIALPADLFLDTGRPAGR
jgi:pilus assembly protein CpaF